MNSPAWRHCVAFVLLWLAVMLAGVAPPAWAGEAPTDQERSLQAARKELDRIQATLADDKIEPRAGAPARERDPHVPAGHDAGACGRRHGQSGVAAHSGGAATLA